MVNAFRWMIFVIGLAVVIGSIIVTSAGSPIIAIYSPSDGETVYSKIITVSGTATVIGEQYIDSVTVNNVQAGRDIWSADILLQEGQNRITVVATTDIGNTATETITVFYNAPTPPLTQTGSISITTIPSGAKVYLDDFFKGTTPITLKDVSVGFHLIKVIKEGYRSETMNIRLGAGETKELNIILKPITSSIIVNSTPSGASVYLDDVDMNKITPCMLSEVAVGQHSIMLTKSGYFNVIRNVSVSVGRTSYLHVNLTGYGSIDISSDPSGASVYIDGNYTGETTPTNISKVALGNHTIKLTKFDYDDVIIGNVSVSVGETLHLHENLIGYGSLSISSIPDGANVFVDGNYTGKTPLDIPKVVEGWHTIKLTRQDYADVEKMILVSAGKPAPVGETLLVLEAAFISKIDLIAIFIALIGLLIGIIILKVSKRKRGALSKLIMKEEDVRRHVESRQKIDFAKRKDIILLNSPEWKKHKDYAKINPLYEKAEELEKRGENKEAIEAYEEIIVINEYYKKAWEGLERNYNALEESKKGDE